MGVLSLRISLLQRGSKIKEISDISSNILDLTKVVLFLVLLAFSSQKSSRCRTGIMLDYKIDQTLDFESVTEISGSSVQIKLPFGEVMLWLSKPPRRGALQVLVLVYILRNMDLG